MFFKLILQFLIPIFGNYQSLFVYDCCGAHFTPAVIQTCYDNNIIPSLLSAGTTPLTYPSDIVMNKPLKSIIKEFMRQDRERKEKKEDIEKWSICQHHVVTTEGVGRVQVEWYKSVDRCKIVIKLFQDTRISLPGDRSCHHEYNITEFDANEMTIIDWAWSEDEAGDGILVSENAIFEPVLEVKNGDYRLQDD